MYNWMRHCHVLLREADVIVVNTFYDLEKTALDASRDDVLGSPSPGVQAKCVLDIGPVLPESYLEEDNDLPEDTDPDPGIAWLSPRASNSILYVRKLFDAFGSPVSRKLALGLEASWVSFLWIVRPQNASGFSAASETTPVTEFLPAGFEERVRELGQCYSR